MTSTLESNYWFCWVFFDFLLRAEHKHKDHYQKVSLLCLGRYESDLNSFPRQDFYLTSI